MEPRGLTRGEIVQLNPEKCKNKMLGGCLLVVSEPKTFGCQGYIQGFGVEGKIGGQAYFRPTWEEMEPTGGFAPWVVP